MASSRNSSGTFTSTEVRDLLRTAAEKLSAREEKALRMRHGVPGEARQPLPRRGQENPDARAELLALEIELTARLAARKASEAPSPPAATAARTPQKDKIIRALRRLK